MRLDHIAYRVANREKTANFFIEALGYRVQTEFDLEFSDGTTTKCIALEPPEKPNLENIPWCHELRGIQASEPAPNYVPTQSDQTDSFNIVSINYHLAPEIFVSDGEPNSIVGQWVKARDGIGGIHHLAYQVDSVEETMRVWKEKGYAEFTSEQPMKCPGLTQCFTKPSQLTGIIYEFIERGEHGFCKDNVKALMESTKNL